jgi:uncharacterized protein (TIGR00730 family)
MQRDPDSPQTETAQPYRAGRSVTVFTGSALGNDASFAEKTAAFAEAAARAGVRIVYGGGCVGLMGVLADAALKSGGSLHGVIPQALVDGEIAHPGLTQLDVVPNMHARKLRMAELGDAFVALPGGAGTLEELFEVWTWQQLGVHSKPVALFNIEGYWTPLLGALDAMVRSGFLGERFRTSLIVEDTADDLFRALETWSPQPPKW